MLPTPSPSPTLPLIAAPTASPAATASATALPSLPHATPAPAPDAEPSHTPVPHRTATPVDLSHPAALSTPKENDAAVTPPPPHHQQLQRQQNGEISQSHSKTVEPLTKSRTLEPKRSSNPLDVCNLLTSADPPPPSKTPPKKRHLNHLSDQQPARRNGDAITSTPKLWSPVESIERERSENHRRLGFMAGGIDYSMPITTTYLKYMRSLGCTDEDALKLENKNVSTLIDHFIREAMAHYFY